MARFRLVDPDKAEGKAKELLEVLKKETGRAANIARLMANAPSVLEAYIGMNKALASGALPAQVREQIALTLANIYNCEYCVAAHTYIGKRVGLSDEEIQAALKGTSSDKKTEAILALAKHLVKKKARVTDGDIEQVKQAGLSDEEIIEVIGHVALHTLTNYFSRVADTPVDFLPE